MNKYIILLIILLIIIILFFKYKLEKFGNIPKINDNIVNILAKKVLFIKEDGTVKVNKKNGEKFIDINNNIITFGDENNIDNNIKVNLDNNYILQCGKFNIDKNGTITDNLNKTILDPSGNIYFDDFIYNKDNDNIKKKDNSLILDSDDNIDFNNYNFNKFNRITHKTKPLVINGIDIDTGNYKYNKNSNNNDTILIDNNLITFDSNENIITDDYKFNLKDNTFSTKDNKIIMDKIGNLKCGDSQINNNYEHKIKIGSSNYIIDKYKIEDTDKKILIMGGTNDIFLNSNNYVYNINSNTLTANVNSLRNINLVPNSEEINFKKYNNITNKFEIDSNYNYDGLGSTIFPVTKIILEKPATANTYNNPLHISSIRFFDYKNNTIFFNLYNTTTSEIDTRYGGPSITSGNLFFNKTINFVLSKSTNILIPTININSSLPSDFSQTSYTPINFIGCGKYNALDLSGTIPTIPTSGLTHQYIFTFTTPQYIKYVEIENRKDQFTSRIIGSYLKTFSTIKGVANILISTTQCVETSINTLSTPTNTKFQPQNKNETYAISDYITKPTNYSPGYKPIIRYYIQ
jgi:hypothetical protein